MIVRERREQSDPPQIQHGHLLSVAATTLHIALLAYGVLLTMRIIVADGAPVLFVLYQLVVVLCSLALVGPGMATLANMLADQRHRHALRQMNRRLEQEVRSRVADSLAIRNALIYGLAKLADYRDNDTGAHLDRIGAYAEILARHLRADPEPDPEPDSEHADIDDQWVERLKLASSLHDIGKVGIPDAVLLKPGKLDERERHLMEQHPLIGADTLLAIRRQIGHDKFLDMGIEVTLQHHEKWDGTGYPFGIRGDMIALSARIVALADFYDAVTSKRVYKDAFTHEEAADLILAERGTRFDPAVADAFLANQDAFRAVRERFADADGAKPKLQALAEHYARHTDLAQTAETAA